jgi:hypothetical protein
MFTTSITFTLINCQSGLNAPRTEPAVDRADFDCRVQPVLAKSCGAFACHGDAKRYFHVFARNRLRMQGSERDRNAALSAVERAANFEATRAFVDASDVDQSFLLLKPLASEAGGYFHRGAEIFGGGNVFASKSDADFKTLSEWAHGKVEDPKCIEPGSDQ